MALVTVFVPPLSNMTELQDVPLYVDLVLFHYVTLAFEGHRGFRLFTTSDRTQCQTTRRYDLSCVGVQPRRLERATCDGASNRD